MIKEKKATLSNYQSEKVVSLDLLSLLTVCVRGVLAAQKYIALELLKVNDFEGKLPDVDIMDYDTQTKSVLLASLHRAVFVDVKKQLDHKEGDAAKDLVTTADIVVQAVVEKVLRDAFPNVPFTIVGEEEAAGGEIKQQAKRCIDLYYSVSAAIPCQTELEAHTEGATRCVSACGLAELRKRVGVFIDPIDGTNCFVEGFWEVPLTLVGITLDGVPVAGVVNRVFRCSTALVTGRSDNTSLSYVWNVGMDRPFVVHNGRRASPAVMSPTVLGPRSVLCVAGSSTTNSEFFGHVLDRLSPIDKVLARGAGNKCMLLVQPMLAGPSSERGCDVYVSPENTIKKWDTCAPHAFILALGGEIYTFRGDVVRYPLNADERASLPAGVLGVSRWCKREVVRRMEWPSCHL